MSFSTILHDVEMGKPRAIHRYFNPGMHEIHIEPDIDQICCFMRHKASVGAAQAWRIPVRIGVTAYPWWIADIQRLEKANGFMLWIYVLITAWLSPFASIIHAKKIHFFYQLGQALRVTWTLLVAQPLYILWWHVQKWT